MKHFKKKVSKALLGTATSMSVLTGCVAEEKPVEEPIAVNETHFDNELLMVDISDVYKEALSDATGYDINHSYTIGDLRKIGTDDALEKIGADLVINVVDDSSLYWLSYCENIRSLIINIGNIDVTYLLNSILVLPNLTYFCLTDFHGNYYSEENLSFLNNDKLSTFDLCGNLVVDKNFLYNMKTLKRLGLFYDSAINLDTDRVSELEKLTNICFLEEPYTTAIYVDTDDYNKLKDKGIEIDFLDDYYKNKFEEANRELDNIVLNLGLKEDVSNQEKLNRIILYTLDNFEYDMDINDMLANGESPSTDKFYKEGYLKAIIEGDGKIICGNYAAIISALVKRAGMDMFMLKSSNHAWNLVELDGEYYYVDATTLDAFNYYEYDDDFVRNLIECGDASSLEWYMKEYQSNEKLGEMYTISNTSYEDIDNIIENNNKVDINYDEIAVYMEEVELEENYDVNVGNNHRSINGGALLGILVGLGFARKVYNNNVKKKKGHKRR